MLLTVKLTGVDKLAARYAGLQQDLEMSLFQEIRELAREGRQAARAAAPVFSGGLRRRIRMSSSRKKLLARVRSTAPHTHFMERGTRPHMPPIDPSKAKRPQSAQDLLNWAKAKGINPYVLARAIARKGTRAHPFMSKARALTGPAFEPRIRAVVDRVLAKYR